jgi:hypothetical protein
VSTIEIKIVSPEIVAALNNLADALRGQGEIVPRTSTTEPVKTEAKTTARKSKAVVEEKAADDAGDAKPAEVSKPSSTSQSETQADDDLTGTPDEGETISVEALGKAITDAVAAGHRPAVVEILKSFNAKRGGDVAEEDRADCFAQISNLPKEG